VNSPTVVIRLELEAAPEILFNDLSESVRMADWLGQHPAYLELIARALELAEKEQAA
jgi:hypothetical protein